MKKSLFVLLLLSMSVVAFTSCEEDPEPEVVDTYEATIQIAGSSLVAMASDDGATARLFFSCDHQWTLEIAEDAQEWLSADKMKGNSTKTTQLTLTAKANRGAARTAVCKIHSGAKTKRFTVEQAAQTLVLPRSEVPDIDRYYQPAEFTFDMLRSDSRWSWCRSRQSEHFVVFWDKRYGEYGLYGSRVGAADTWPSTAGSKAMRVDIDDLLRKAEQFYDVNVNTLKMVETGHGKSVLDKYKMQIYIYYQSEWLATGSGYDNRIGALWVNPSTCQPVGSTIAHEIGHSFQYMVYCDYLLAGGTDDSHGPGWRYGFGPDGAGGCGWWEQCAQWQSFQTYKSEAFSTYYADEFYTSTHLHILHERPRYANYFIQWWWTHQHGTPFIGTLWRSARYPEDPCETYMRLTGMDNAAFNDDMWRYAAHCLTFDFDAVRTQGRNSIGRTALSGTHLQADGDYWRIADAKAPESTGSNAIALAAAAGKTIQADFRGLYSMTGGTYRCGPRSHAGWRYGFVSYNSDGSTTYSNIASDAEGSVTFDVPQNSSKLWFVVTGAPQTYERHPWPTGDKADTDTDDNKWPWEAAFSGTKPSGK